MSLIIKELGRRDFLKTIGLGLGTLVLPGRLFAEQRSSEKRPNIILILTDDQGYGELACHGNKIIKTPNLDRLYNESTRFTRFQVSPTCAPTRAALMTGCHEYRVGVSSVFEGRSLLSEDAVTLADVLSDTGYKTALFGKWHLGENYPCRAEDNGFEEVLTHGDGALGTLPDYWGNTYFDPTLKHNGKWVKTKGYGTDIFFDTALNWIEKNQKNPFFAYISTNAPHAPYMVPESYVKPYLEAGLKSRNIARFYGMITNIDDNIGHLIEKLREFNLDKNTLIIFMTDNGSCWANQVYNAGMREGKGSPHEGGSRVPCFFYWPGKLKAGVDIDRIASHMDILPTLAEICGADLLKDLNVDGKSLLPLLNNPKTDWPDRFMFIMPHPAMDGYPSIKDNTAIEKGAIRSQKFRLVRNKELYDMENDPGETHNVIDKHPDTVSQMRTAYYKWWKEVSKNVMEPVRIKLGSRFENPTRLNCIDWRPIKDMPQPYRFSRVWNTGPKSGPKKVAGWLNDRYHHSIREEELDVKEIESFMGLWAVDITRSGRYKTTLYIFPPEASEKAHLKPGRAHVLCGKTGADKPIVEGASSVTLEVQLEKGPADLKCWFSGQFLEDNPLGALYVDIEYLG